jgi:hypothetical protein
VAAWLFKIGRRLVPLKPNSKKPACKDWAEPHPRIPLDRILDHIRAGGNYGVCGTPDQPILDYDNRHLLLPPDAPAVYPSELAAFMACENALDDPQGAWMVVDSRKGQHRYYQATTPVTNMSLGFTADVEAPEEFSCRANNEYVVGPYCEVDGHYYRVRYFYRVGHSPEDAYAPPAAALVHEVIRGLRDRGLVDRKGTPKAPIGPEGPSVPLVRTDAPEAEVHDAPPDEAREFMKQRPGAVAGYGKARRQHFALVCQLVGFYGLDKDRAVALLVEWGKQVSNTYRDGTYYPWTRREHEDSVKKALALKARGKLRWRGRKKNSFGSCKRRMMEIDARLKDNEHWPHKTRTDKSHPWGYNVSPEERIDIGAQVLFLGPGDEGQNGTTRHKAYYHKRNGHALNWYIFMAVRDALSDLGVINWQDEEYVPPWHDEPGRCCRWRSDLKVIDDLLRLPPLI